MVYADTLEAARAADARGERVVLDSEEVKAIADVADLEHLDTLHLRWLRSTDGLERLAGLRRLVVTYDAVPLAPLQGLESLALHGYKPVPDDIVELPNLRELEVVLKPELDVEAMVAVLARCPALTSLTLRNAAALPEAVVALERLTTLSLLRPPGLPANLGAMPALEVLRIHRHGLEALPASLASCATLRELTVRTGPLASLPDLSGLDRLALLQVEENALTHLDELPERVHVRWAHNPIDPVPAWLAARTPEAERTAPPPGLGADPDASHAALEATGLETLPYWLEGHAGLWSIGASRNPGFREVPAWVGALPRLDRLKLDGTGVASLPSAVFRAPRLLSLALGKTPLEAARPTLRKDLENMLKAARKQGLGGDDRVLHAALLLEEADTLKAVGPARVATALASTSRPVRAAAEAWLTEHLPSPFDGTEATVALAGTLEGVKASDVKKRLKPLGLTVVKDPASADVVVLGPGADAAACAAPRIGVRQHLLDRMHADEKPFLMAPEAAPLADNAVALLTAADPATVLVGLKTLQAGGLSGTLVDEVAALALCHPERKVRSLAKKVFAQHAPGPLQAALKLSYLGKKAESAMSIWLRKAMAIDGLDPQVLPERIVTTTGRGVGFVASADSGVPDPARILEGVASADAARHALWTAPLASYQHFEVTRSGGGTLSLEDAGLQALTPALGAVKGVHTLIVARNTLAELPDTIGAMGLTELSVWGNKSLTTLPGTLGAGLRRLRMNHGAFRKPPEGLGRLVDLEQLELNGTKRLDAKAWAKAVGDLPSLKVLQLPKEVEAHAEAFRAALPAGAEVRFF